MEDLKPEENKLEENPLEESRPDNVSCDHPDQPVQSKSVRFNLDDDVEHGQIQSCDHTIHDTLNEAKVHIYCDGKPLSVIDGRVRFADNEPDLFKIAFHDSLQFSIFANELIVRVNDNQVIVDKHPGLPNECVFVFSQEPNGRIGAKNHNYSEFSSTTICIHSTKTNTTLGLFEDQLMAGIKGRITFDIIENNKIHSCQKRLFTSYNGPVKVRDYIAEYTLPIVFAESMPPDLNYDTCILYRPVGSKNLIWKTSAGEVIITELGKSRTDGINGVNGLNGKDGVDGKDGKDGVNGVNGVDGKDGIDGKDGVNGVDGKDGKDGVNGVDGKDGKDGVDGKDGKDGLNGKDGVDGKDGLNGVVSFPILAPSDLAYTFASNPSSGLGMRDHNPCIMKNNTLHTVFTEHALSTNRPLELVSETTGTLQNVNGHLYWKTPETEYNLTDVKPVCDANTYSFKHDSLTGLQSYSVGNLALTVGGTDMITISEQQVEINTALVSHNVMQTKRLTVDGVDLKPNGSTLNIGTVRLLADPTRKYQIKDQIKVGDPIGISCHNKQIIAEKVSGYKWSLVGSALNLQAVLVESNYTLYVKNNCLFCVDDLSAELTEQDHANSLLLEGLTGDIKLKKAGQKYCIAYKSKDFVHIIVFSIVDRKITKESQLNKDLREVYNFMCDEDILYYVYHEYSTDEHDKSAPRAHKNNLTLEQYSLENLQQGSVVRGLTSEYIGSFDNNKTLNILKLPGQKMIISYGIYKVLLTLSGSYDYAPVSGNTVIDADSIDCISMIYDISNGIVVSVEKTITNSCFIQQLDVYGNVLNIIKSKVINAVNPISLTYMNDQYILYTLYDNKLIAYVIENQDIICVKNKYTFDTASESILVNDLYVYNHDKLYSFDKSGIEPQQFIGLASHVADVVSVAFKGQLMYNLPDIPDKYIGKKVYLDNIEKDFPDSISDVESRILIGTVLDPNTLLVGL